MRGSPFAPRQRINAPPFLRSWTGVQALTQELALMRSSGVAVQGPLVVEGLTIDLNGPVAVEAVAVALRRVPDLRVRTSGTVAVFPDVDVNLTSWPGSDLSVWAEGNMDVNADITGDVDITGWPPGTLSIYDASR